MHITKSFGLRLTRLLNHHQCYDKIILEDSFVSTKRQFIRAIFDHLALFFHQLDKHTLEWFLHLDRF